MQTRKDARLLVSSPADLAPPGPDVAAQLARLRVTLRVTGLTFVTFFTVALISSVARARAPYPLYQMFGWGSVGDAEEVMISVVYIVWGWFLWLAAKDPAAARLFVDFTLVANAAHFGVMLIQAIFIDGEHLHLVGDVPLGWLLLAVLAWGWVPVRRQLTRRAAHGSVRDAVGESIGR